jgi:hypothetical protein
MPKKLINPTKNSLARIKRNNKKAAPKKIIVEDIPLKASDSDQHEYQARASQLNARIECVKCGRKIEGKSKAHLVVKDYEFGHKTVCIPCFEEAVFGRKGRR